MYTITISQDDKPLYTQTVERLDLTAVINAVNQTPPAPKKKRSDAGKPRPSKPATLGI